MLDNHKKRNKIAIVVGTILAIFIIFNLYRIYCFYETKNIYDDYIYILEERDIEMAEQYQLTNCVSWLNYLVNDKLHTSNYKIKIKSWNVYIYGNKGILTRSITTYFYDDNNNIISIQTLTHKDNDIEFLEKRDDTWFVSGGKFIP